MRANLEKDRPDSISVTQLLGCARKVYLEGTTDFAVPPADNYATFRGSIIHSVLSDARPEAERIEREYKSVIISGQMDSVRVGHIEGRTLIRDWKTTKSLPYYDNAYSNHQQQVNLYRWLGQYDPRLTDLEIVYLSMEGVKIIPLKRGGKNRYGGTIANQVWSDEEVEAFLDERLLVLDAQRRLESPLTYENVPEDDLWQCDYCPVRKLCYTLAAGEARNAWAKGEKVSRVPPRERKKKGK